MRTVTIRQSEGFQRATETTRQDTNRIIGYLVNWSIGSERYAHCNLYCHNDGNIDAIYHSGNPTDKQVPYVMAAIRSATGTYSVHS